MIEIIRDFFSYEFIQRALLVGILVALCSALLGVSLVLKRFSMIGDGLSHVAFGALSIALALNMAPLQIAIPVVIVAAFFLLKITESSKVKADSAIALIASSSMAIGVVVTSLKGGLNNDVMGYIFGSMLAIEDSDAVVSIVLSIVVLFIYIVMYNKIFAITFDENFAKASGINTQAFNLMLSLLTAVTIVIGMRIMGAMLISSLIIFPALTSMRIFKSFKSVIISSAIISVICFAIGLFVSYILEIPAGPSVVIINLVVFIIFSLFGFVIKRK